MAARSSTRSLRRLLATIRPAPTTISPSPAMPPEIRYGICASTRSLDAAPFQPRKTSTKPARQ